MKIEFDGVVEQFVRNILIGLYASGELPRHGELDEEGTFLKLLQAMVKHGAAVHSFDSQTKVDTFRITGRAVKHWSYLFPNLPCRGVREDMYHVRIRRPRSEFFYRDWMAVDPREIVPSWPS